ncbi:redoxin domain-containing protein [Paraburkholderia acidisoli]|uniref:Thioredoxin peroxidase n=1 Tax=Paraburkholderia acidisoli TaxID=2571748 RepID=A0A7Z2GPZ7_9BURK|nr:redoxin domain-containing protein [Paraburkholderia acidisoli]QGZ65636.1 redoxin domain-containing protein [Paraburkholderia acidisoli]
MTLPVGSLCPDFTANASTGALRFHEWHARGWSLVFAFKSMSPTCSTEFAALETLMPQFVACGTKVLGVSIDSEPSVAAWLADLQAMFACTPSFALVNDASGEVPRALGFVDETAAPPALLRTALLVGPDARVAVSLTYTVTNGRNFDELLRIVKAVQLTAARRVATPATWREGGRVMLPPSLAQDTAEAMYPGGVDVLRPYLRFVDQPD